MILADKIINLRKKNGWSQEELAEKLGVSRQSISKYESAQSIPDLDKILKLSENTHRHSPRKRKATGLYTKLQWKWRMNICRSLTGRQEK